MLTIMETVLIVPILITLGYVITSTNVDQHISLLIRTKTFESICDVVCVIWQTSLYVQTGEESEAR